jgi:hypothetical protein
MGHSATVNVSHESHQKAKELKNRINKKHRFKVLLKEIYVVAIDKGIDNVTEEELLELYRPY